MNEPGGGQHMKQDPESIEPRPMTENEVRQWTMAMHIGLLVGFTVPIVGALAPAVMWFMRRGRSERIGQHGAMLVNAALSYHGYILVTFLLSLFVFGMLPFVVLVAAVVMVPVIGAVKANDGVLWQYPLIREFVKRPGTGGDHGDGHGADEDGVDESEQGTERQAA